MLPAPLLSPPGSRTGIAADLAVRGAHVLPEHAPVLLLAPPLHPLGGYWYSACGLHHSHHCCYLPTKDPAVKYAAAAPVATAVVAGLQDEEPADLSPV
jgi:hypothetical protein